MITGNISDQTDLQSALNAKANTADLGDMAFEDDALSDGKEYVRKNGAWAESSGGGSGLPAGGTIGQVLAKRSNTDGDAGWYNLRHLPTDKWYLPDGIVESDVIAAYQFVNRLDEAEALININDGVKYGLSKVGNPSWTSERGFYFNASTAGNGLDNSTIRAMSPENIVSAVFGFSGLQTTGSAGAGGFGISKNHCIQLRMYGANTGYINKIGINQNYNTEFAYINSQLHDWGVVGGNWYASTSELYYNGQLQSLTTPDRAFNNVTYTSIIGQINTTSNKAPFYITAVVLLRVTLNASQHLQLSDNIIALGGI